MYWKGTYFREIPHQKRRIHNLRRIKLEILPWFYLLGGKCLSMCTRSVWVVVEAHWWITNWLSSAWYSCINNRAKLWKQVKSFVDFRKAVSARLRLLNLYGNNLHVTTCSRITSFLSNEPETSNVLLHNILDFDDKRVALDKKQISIGNHTVSSSIWN